MTSVGAIVRERREELELSREELGRRVGRTRQAIYNIEQGSSLPDRETLMKLARVLAPEEPGFLDSLQRAVDHALAMPRATRRQTLQAGIGLLTSPVIRSLSEPTRANPEPVLRADDGRGGESEGGFERALRLGGELSAKAKHAEALKRFELAANRARTPVETAKAWARVAAAYRALNNARSCAEAIGTALAALKLEELGVDRYVTTDLIERRISDDPTRRVYAELVDANGYLALKADAQARAENIYKTLWDIGLVLRDGAIEGTARHSLGRVCVNLGTRVRHGDESWTVLSDAAQVAAALPHLEAAHRLHKAAGDEVYLAHDARNLALVLRLLRIEADAADDAEAEAYDLLQHKEALINLLMDQGQWAMDAGDDKRAAGRFHEVIERAVGIQSPFLLSGAFARLAALYCSTRACKEKAASRLHIREYAIGALLAWTWPEGFRARDFRRSADLLRAMLRESPRDEDRRVVHSGTKMTERFLSVSIDHLGHVYHLLAKMPHFNQEAAQRVHIRQIASDLQRVWSS